MKEYLYSLPFSYENGINIAHPTGKFAHENFPASKYAVDFLLNPDTPILAAREGEVILVCDNVKWHGLNPKRATEVNLVAIDHGDGTGAEYVHMAYKKIMVKKNQIVAKGELLGYSGFSGVMTEPHLHFNTFKFLSKKTGISIPATFAIKFYRG